MPWKYDCYYSGKPFSKVNQSHKNRPDLTCLGLRLLVMAAAANSVDEMRGEFGEYTPHGQNIGFQLP